MSWQLTFGGSLIVNDTEGIFRARIGLVAPVVSLTPLVRGLGVLAKVHGHHGTEHEIDVVYDATEAQVATYRARLQALMTVSGAGTVPSGALVVPKQGTFARCVLMRCDEVECSPALVNFAASRTAGDDGFLMAYTLRFAQLGS